MICSCVSCLITLQLGHEPPINLLLYPGRALISISILHHLRLYSLFVFTCSKSLLGYAKPRSLRLAQSAADGKVLG